tara:strand:- start:2195 stop:2830 length:636 start_codon:yes stop_codon:yes gene_type:complete
MFDKKKKKEEEVEEEESTPSLSEALEGLMNSQPDLRTMMLYGEVNEEKIQELIVGTIMMTQAAAPNSYDEDGNLKPMKLYLSTYGGAADDMFSFYDILNQAKESCELHTIGLGKVMSAGVLLLAAGTKGHRYIGKNCRVMIHAVSAGNIGELHNLQNEMEAIQQLQDSYTNALVQETSMTKRQLNKLLDRKVNVYLTAQEAIEYGIADKIL